MYLTLKNRYYIKTFYLLANAIEGQSQQKLSCRSLNTSYLTDSYIVFTLKMESAPKIKNFGLKMMMKSGLEKIILKFLHALIIFC